MLEKLNKENLIKYFLSENGKSNSFTANVILCNCKNPTKKLKGLYRLHIQNRITHSSYDIFGVLIDGEFQDISVLERY